MEHLHNPGTRKMACAYGFLPGMNRATHVSEALERDGQTIGNWGEELNKKDQVTLQKFHALAI